MQLLQKMNMQSLDTKRLRTHRGVAQRTLLRVAVPNGPSLNNRDQILCNSLSSCSGGSPPLSSYSLLNGLGIAASGPSSTSRDQILCNSFSSSSSSLHSSPLSTYSLLNRLGSPASSHSSTSRNWLAEAVPTIVSSLPRSTAAGSSPVLHVVRSSPTEAVQVTDASSNGWQQTRSWPSFQNAAGVILVQPISSPTGDWPSTSSPLTSNLPVRQSWRSQPAHAAHDGHSDAFFAHSRSRDGDAPSPCTCPEVHTTSDSCGGCDGSAKASYYGMVVQSGKVEVDGVLSGEVGGVAPPPPDGCYVLKVCRGDAPAGSGSCGCTHYSLTRVSSGDSLHAQLRDAWLSSGPVMA